MEIKEIPATISIPAPLLEAAEKQFDKWGFDDLTDFILDSMRRRLSTLWGHPEPPTPPQRPPHPARAPLPADVDDILWATEEERQKLMDMAGDAVVALRGATALAHRALDCQEDA